MTGRIGDRVQLESERVGQPVREGEILEVIQGTASVRYRVRWSDGHESVLTPSVGSARIVPGTKTQPKPRTRTKRTSS